MGAHQHMYESKYEHAINMNIYIDREFAYVHPCIDMNISIYMCNQYVRISMYEKLCADPCLNEYVYLHTYVLTVYTCKSINMCVSTYTTNCNVAFANAHENTHILLPIACSPSLSLSLRLSLSLSLSSFLSFYLFCTLSHFFFLSLSFCIYSCLCLSHTHTFSLSPPPSLSSSLYSFSLSHTHTFTRNKFE